MTISMSPKHAEAHADSLQIKRRTLLALLLAAPTVGWATRAAAATPGTAATDGRFLALSKFGTGRSSLDPALGTSVLAALRDSDPALSSTLDELAAAAASGKHSD